MSYVVMSCIILQNLLLISIAFQYNIDYNNSNTYVCHCNV